MLISKIHPSLHVNCRLNPVLIWADQKDDLWMFILFVMEEVRYNLKIECRVYVLNVLACRKGNPHCSS
jgi:hypothetical protein